MSGTLFPSTPQDGMTPSRVVSGPSTMSLLAAALGMAGANPDQTAIPAYGSPARFFAGPSTSATAGTIPSYQEYHAAQAARRAQAAAVLASAPRIAVPAAIPRPVFAPPAAPAPAIGPASPAFFDPQWDYSRFPNGPNDPSQWGGSYLPRGGIGRGGGGGGGL